MANHLKMAIIQAILRLQELRWSQRRIAEELGIDRRTVKRHLIRHLGGSKCTISPAGSATSNATTFHPLPAPAGGTTGDAADAGSRAGPKCANPPAGSSPADAASNAANPPAGSAAVARCKNATRVGRHSACEPHRELILAKLEQGLSAQRIWQDLVADHQFTAEYDSVKRFVRRWRTASAIPFRRLECAPGEQAQVDFGSGAPVIGPDGKRRKTHVFRIVLSYSRKAYSEATFTQTTDDFLRCLENALVYFGGPPKTLIIDNLKAAVAHPDWFDPELTPKVQSFCQHYGTVILPTKPYMPRHKGKVESGVKYVKNNALQRSLVHQPGRTEPFPARLGTHRRRHADSRHDQAASRQGLCGSGASCLAAAAVGTFPLLSRRPAHCRSRRARGSRQGLLFACRQST